MNKIKLLYDVFKTMKEKDVFKGTLKVEGMKDQAKIFGFENAFERSNLTGQTKAKTNSEVDYDGKKMKMENNIDCEMQGCQGLHGFMKHVHSHHPGHSHFGAHPGGIKDGLNKVVFVLGVLNSLKAEEKEDKSVLLSLELADIPEDLKNALHEHMKHVHEHTEHMDNSHHPHMFMKEFHSMEKTDFKLNVCINKNNEIEKVTIDVSGIQTDEKNVQHDMKFSAELCHVW